VSLCGAAFEKEAKQKKKKKKKKKKRSGMLLLYSPLTQSYAGLTSAMFSCHCFTVNQYKGALLSTVHAEKQVEILFRLIFLREKHCSD
jgi:hypothetical protein